MSGEPARAVDARHPRPRPRAAPAAGPPAPALPAAPSPGRPPLTPSAVLALQRSAGNAAVQRYFPPPAMGVGTATVVKTGGTKPGVPVVKPGFSLDKEKVAATEIANNGHTVAGDKTTRLTALLTPKHAKLAAGGATVPGIDPIGWAWIVANEARSAKRQRISHWVRFHLLNAGLGGKGRNALHLVPADQGANGRWRTQVESWMKVALTTSPVHYDVQVTYYQKGEAPPTYGPPVAPVDYASNIELFPKTIHAEWSVYDVGKGVWVPQTPCTVASGKPAAPGQQQHELVGAPDLRRLASVYGVHEDVLALVASAPAPLPQYAAVRRMLELWVAASTNHAQFVARNERVAGSETPLRSSLTGLHNRKLTLHGAFVPDDDTPEARHAVNPALVKDIAQFAVVFDAVTDSIRAGFFSARRPDGRATLADFLHHYLHNGSLSGDSLAKKQADWDAFCAANPAMPPLEHSDWAPEGEEVLTVVTERLKAEVPGVVRHAWQQEVGRANPAADELAAKVAARVPTFVRANLPSLKVGVYHVPADAWKVMRTDPAVVAWETAVRTRLDWHRLFLARGARYPDDVLAVPLDDRAAMDGVAQWYTQWKARQETRTQDPPAAPQKRPLEADDRPERVRDRPAPRGPAPVVVDAYNAQVIAAVLVRCGSRRGDAQIDRRVRVVLASWQVAARQGTGDSVKDVQRALDYILGA